MHLSPRTWFKCAETGLPEIPIPGRYRLSSGCLTPECTRRKAGGVRCRGSLKVGDVADSGQSLWVGQHIFAFPRHRKPLHRQCVNNQRGALSAGQLVQRPGVTESLG